MTVEAVLEDDHERSELAGELRDQAVFEDERAVLFSCKQRERNKSIQTEARGNVALDGLTFASDDEKDGPGSVEETIVGPVALESNQR